MSTTHTPSRTPDSHNSPRDRALSRCELNRCPSTPGVTLLGDAAHPDDYPAAVKEYEREMFERTSAAARCPHTCGKC